MSSVKGRKKPGPPSPQAEGPAGHQGGTFAVVLVPGALQGAVHSCSSSPRRGCLWPQRPWTDAHA